MSTTQIQMYDREIEYLKKSLAGNSPALLEKKGAWTVTDQESLVLRSDMAYELGGGTHAAVSGLAFTTNAELVSESGVYLIGNDLPHLKSDVSYARITLLLLDEDVMADVVGNTSGDAGGDVSEDASKDAGGSSTSINALYQLLRRIEYTRYHIYPEGYMMRISAVHEREPVRISKEALACGMDFAAVGQSFIDAYKKTPGVKGVQIYYITDPAMDYAKLGAFARKSDDITQSLNQVFKGFSMDCSTCGQKALCDEIDGLKELHLKLAEKA